MQAPPQVHQGVHHTEGEMMFSSVIFHGVRVLPGELLFSLEIARPRGLQRGRRTGRRSSSTSNGDPAQYHSLWDCRESCLTGLLALGRLPATALFSDSLVRWLTLVYEAAVCRTDALAFSPLPTGDTPSFDN